ncbi:TIGR01459 family HAD-type hydrolase [Roseobacter litoralis]|uniref:TIGR01459 family HAD-type hydrolase n=1 Tax=Roseobacter litoralis TaxID=42443 RepID=UPI002490240A|nr:TIGR01459 family HAD-type hydrolase [Roseobacter litoralis]
MSYAAVLSTEAAFDRYEQVRDRLPGAQFCATPQACRTLEDVAPHVDAFVLDAFGVLNVGATPIPGAVDRIAKLRAVGKRLIVLTNAASDDHAFAVAKFRGLGFDFSADEIVTSRDVCVQNIQADLPKGRWGAVCKASDTLEDIDLDIVAWTADTQPAVDGILMLSSERIDDALMQALEQALLAQKRPLVCANPDLVAPRETGLSCEPGFFTHALADRTGVVPQFFGKPFGNAFQAVMERLGAVSPDRVAMVGDTLHTDVLGGAAAGMKTVLIEDHGLFKGHDVGTYMRRCGIRPDFVCPTT